MSRPIVGGVHNPKFPDKQIVKVQFADKWNFGLSLSFMSNRTVDIQQMCRQANQWGDAALIRDVGSIQKVGGTSV